MAYTNHVILKGLDEARAHQRGLDVGQVPGEKPKPKVRNYRTVKELTEEERVAIAHMEGSQKEIAQKFNICVGRVTVIRQRYGTANRRASNLTLAMRREIGQAAGKIRDIAAQFGVTEAVVNRCRREVRDGIV